MTELPKTQILECPVEDCDVKIIGRYRELLAHVRTQHPLESRAVVRDDGQTYVEQIKEAQQDQLAERIQKEMVVDDE